MSAPGQRLQRTRGTGLRGVAEGMEGAGTPSAPPPDEEAAPDEEVAAAAEAAEASAQSDAAA